jgi:Na+/proline symporter
LLGLYWRTANPAGASLAMVFGTLTGRAAYFLIGFYVAALVSTAVSMTIMLLVSFFAPRHFEWQQLRGGES